MFQENIKMKTRKYSKFFKKASPFYCNIWEEIKAILGKRIELKKE